MAATLTVTLDSNLIFSYGGTRLADRRHPEHDAFCRSDGRPLRCVDRDRMVFWQETSAGRPCLVRLMQLARDSSHLEELRISV